MYVLDSDCLQLTYKELKRFTKFTQVRQIDCLQLTYKELKPRKYALLHLRISCLQLTYKELKLNWIGKVVADVFGFVANL